MNNLSFPRPRQSEIGERLRAELREFIDGWHGNRHGAAAFSDFDPEFSEALGRRGWIGMGFPKRYGGGGYGLAERLVVLEELLAVRAPIFAHAVAERQSGPLLLRFGNEQVRSLTPHNTGTIVWQLNANWPVVSWAAVDFREHREPL